MPPGDLKIYSLVTLYIQKEEWGGRGGGEEGHKLYSTSDTNMIEGTVP
jgi:hypothetical protein